VKNGKNTLFIKKSNIIIDNSKMVKPIIIIDVFIDSDLKKDIFISNLEKFKQLDIPILLICNKPLTIEIQKSVDYVLFDNQNLLFQAEYKYDINIYHTLSFENFTFKSEYWYKQEHGLSVLCNLTKSVEFVKKLGFTKFIHFEWDYFIHDDDLKSIKNLIYDFLNKNSRAYFVNTTETTFYFWMVDIDFWIDKFPKILCEDDYKNYLGRLGFNKNFKKAEDVVFIAFKDFLKEHESINAYIFLKSFTPKSQLNLFTSDFNFGKPNLKSCFRGLCKVEKNEKLIDQLIIFTFNSGENEIVENLYTIKFDDKIQKFNHKLIKKQWRSNLIEEFQFYKFPIELQINEDFKKTYHSLEEINNKIIYNS
jgi:hypothetical protein